MRLVIYGHDRRASDQPAVPPSMRTVSLLGVVKLLEYYSKCGGGWIRRHVRRPLFVAECEMGAVTIMTPYNASHQQWPVVVLVVIFFLVN